MGIAVENHMKNTDAYLQTRVLVASAGRVEGFEQGSNTPGLKGAFGSAARLSLFVAEVKVREFLERQGGPKMEGMRFDPLSEVQICDSVSTRTTERLQKILRNFEHVFIPKGDLPPAIEGGAHKILLKPDAKVVCCPQMKFTPAKVHLSLGGEGSRDRVVRDGT
jgi:hypothetical protein